MKHYHINLSKEDLKGAQHMFIVGDPARTEVIAHYLKDPQELMFNREYRTFLAYIEENPIVIASMGIGGPSAAVGLEEFGRCDITTIIRVGTSGILHPQVKLGDIVSAVGAIRDEGTTKQYLPPEFPAVANPDVVIALRKGAFNLNLQDCFHEGIVHSKDAFWSEEPEMIPAKRNTIERWETWKRGQALITEMEVSTLFILGTIRGWRTGAIMAAIGEFESGKLVLDTKAGHVESIKTAIAGMQLLLNQDI
ncbi:MAG: nucleoside phosphorylase [Candidatus Thorarchaeota archaeon]